MLRLLAKNYKTMDILFLKQVVDTIIWHIEHGYFTGSSSVALNDLQLLDSYLAGIIDEKENNSGSN